MSKYLKLSLLSFALFSPGVFAVQPGIGVSIRSNDINIYAPIDIGSSVRVEPFIGQTKSSRKNDTDKSSSEQQEFGIGVFGLGTVTDNLGLYYGARAARVESRYYRDYEYDYGEETQAGYSRSEDKYSGYKYAPVLGFEYKIIPKFSVGAETSWEFTDLDGKHSSVERFPYNESPENANSYKSADKQNNTMTRVMFRYFF